MRNKESKNVVPKVTDVLQALKPHSDDPATRRLIRATWVYLMNNARHLRKHNWGVLVNTFKEVTGGEDMPTMVEVHWFPITVVDFSFNPLLIID